MPLPCRNLSNHCGTPGLGLGPGMKRTQVGGSHWELWRHLKPSTATFSFPAASFLHPSPPQLERTTVNEWCAPPRYSAASDAARGRMQVPCHPRSLQHLYRGVIFGLSLALGPSSPDYR